MQGTVIDSNTAVNLGILVLLIGAVIRVTVLLTQIRADLALHKDTPEEVKKIGQNVAMVKGRVTALEDDVNNLWAFAVSDDPARLFGRLRRGPRSKINHEDASEEEEE